MSKTTAAKTTISQKMLKIGRMGWTYTRDHLDDPKLSNVQYRVCAAIHTDPDLSQDDVAKSLGMDKSSVAKLVFKLIKLGYVEREINPEDRRQYKLRLTEEGVAKTEEFLDLLNNWEKTVFAAIGPNSYEACQKDLARFLEIAEAMADSE